MPITYDWDNPEQTLIRLRAEGAWNWNDLHKTMRRAGFWLDAVDHPVDLILDLRGGDRLPAGALGQIRSLGRAVHPNGRDRLLIIGLDPVVAGPLGGEEGVYRTNDRAIYFAPDEAAAHGILMDWGSA